MFTRFYIIIVLLFGKHQQLVEKYFASCTQMAKDGIGN